MCDLTDPRIVETYTAIVEGSAINWLILGYNDTRDVISLYSRGSEGLSEFRHHLTDEVLYGYVRIDDKFLLITWVPEQVSGVRRARALVHSRSVAALLKHHHTQLTASNLEDLNETNLRTRLKLDGNYVSEDQNPVVAIPPQRQPSNPSAAAAVSSSVPSPISPTGSEPMEEFVDTSEQFTAHQQQPPVPPPRKANMASPSSSPPPAPPPSAEVPAAVAATSEHSNNGSPADAREVDGMDLHEQQQQEKEEHERQISLQQQRQAEEEEVERKSTLALQEEEERERQRKLAEEAAAVEAKRLQEAAEKKAQEEAAAAAAAAAAEKERLQREEEERLLKEKMEAEQRRLAEEKRMIQQKLLEAEKKKDVVLSGYVSVQPSKSPFWSRRYFMIKDKTLSFYRDESATHPLVQVDLRNVTRLSNVNVDIEPFIPNAFVLETPQSGAFQLFADDKRDMETIVTALQTVM